MDYKAWVDRASRFVRSLSYLPGAVTLRDDIEPSISELALAYPGSAHASDRDWLDSTKCTLPTELRAFLWTGSRRCLFRYDWQPPPEVSSRISQLFPGRTNLLGGADFCEAAKYSNYDHRDAFAQLSFELPSEFVEMLKKAMPGVEPPAPDALASMFGSAILQEQDDRKAGRISLIQLDNSDAICLELNETTNAHRVIYVTAADRSTPMILWPSFDEFLKDWEGLSYIYPSFANLKHWLEQESHRIDLRNERTDYLRSLLATQT